MRAQGWSHNASFWHHLPRDIQSFVDGGGKYSKTFWKNAGWHCTSCIPLWDLTNKWTSIGNGLSTIDQNFTQELLSLRKNGGIAQHLHLLHYIKLNWNTNKVLKVDE